MCWHMRVSVRNLLPAQQVPADRGWRHAGRRPAAVNAGDAKVGAYAGRPAGRGRFLDRSDQASACVARSRTSSHDALRAGIGDHGAAGSVCLVVLHVCENTGRDLQAQQGEPRGYGI
jgi:hypothetical protein